MADDKIKYLDYLGLNRIAEDLEYRHPSTFTGTRAAWEALPEDRKRLYKIVNFLDDDDNEEDPKHPTIFVGTRAEWNNLTEDEKSKYIIICLTDDLQGDGWYLVNKVEKNNMNPVTSNAVAEAIEDMNSVYVTDEVVVDFNNTTSAIYYDDKITEDSIVTVYYKNPSIAEAAEISAYSGNGQITFTAVTAPSSGVVCRFSCLLPKN